MDRVIHTLLLDTIANSAKHAGHAGGLGDAAEVWLARHAVIANIVTQERIGKWSDAFDCVECVFGEEEDEGVVGEEDEEDEDGVRPAEKVRTDELASGDKTKLSFFY